MRMVLGPHRLYNVLCVNGYLQIPVTLAEYAQIAADTDQIQCNLEKIEIYLSQIQN